MSSLPQRLCNALVGLTPEHPEALEALRPLYAHDMVFRDPIQEVRGLDAFLALNKRLLKRMKRLHWHVSAISGTEDEMFLEWHMSGAPTFGPAIEVSGVTRARAHDGLIVDHRDYWDMGEMLASAVPGGQRVLHFLRLPFA